MSLSDVLLAAGALCFALSAQADGLHVGGYLRTGSVYGAQEGVKGGITLGGDLQKFRLGNEGDFGLEFVLSQEVRVLGLNWQLNYTPVKWNQEPVRAEQANVELSGLSFVPEARFWIGQRRVRLHNIEIVDRFVMGWGDNLGVGAVDLPLGQGKLGLGLFSAEKLGRPQRDGARARRLNLDVSGPPGEAGGQWRLLFTAVRGQGLLGSQSGAGLAVSHEQSDFLVEGLGNLLLLQAARGHARIDGQFEGGEGLYPGAKVLRLADALHWQYGPLGGQLLLGFQTHRAEGAAARARDWALGGRVSYALTQNFKLLAEVGATLRTGPGPAQQLQKWSVAPALALGPEFRSRPELRFYLMHSRWNRAAALAHAEGFGAGNRTGRTLAGVQYEVWW